MSAAAVDLLPVAIRPAGAEDLPFIMDSWLKSYEDDARREDRRTDLAHVRHGDYQAGQRQVIEALLGNDSLAVACSADAPSSIFGWICADDSKFEGGVNTPRLHYVYVKGPFRHMGIARRLMDRFALLDTPPLTVTHLTRSVLAWMGKHDVRYNPYLAWR